MRKTPALLFFFVLALSIPAALGQGATLYVNNTDPTCGGLSPCFSTIQAAVDAAQPADTVTIQPGTYIEAIDILDKNNFAGASETDRIVIQADPAAAPGSVVVDGLVDTCSGGDAIVVEDSHFVTLTGLVITGAGRKAISLEGNGDENQAIHIEGNTIFGTGSESCDGGIRVKKDNLDTVITGNSIFGNGGHGIIVEESLSSLVSNNSIFGNGKNGIEVEHDNADTQIVSNRVFGNLEHGIEVEEDNVDTLIVNNLVYDNGRNGIRLGNAGDPGGPHYVVNNTVHSNGRNGVKVQEDNVTFLVNNSITQNGSQTGSSAGFGIESDGDQVDVTLLNNLICGNRLGELDGDLLDAADSANLTPNGTEGVGVLASPGCEVETKVYADLEGPDALANTVDDDFTLRSTSPAIDQGTDPRNLGLDPAFNPIFEADFSRDSVRPRDGDLSATAEFDIGALEFGAPVADAGEDLNALVSVEITLDGSASFDPKGSQITFAWTLVSAPAGSTATLSDTSQPQPEFTPDLAGDYLFELVVNDGTENSLAEQVTVSAFTTNAPPNARAGEDQNALVGAPVFLDGSDSEDPEGAPLDFSWTFGNVPSTSGLTDANIFDPLTATPAFTPDVEGAFVVDLDVSDPVLSDQDSVRVRATQPGARPNADAGPDGLGSTQQVGLDASASFDPDGAPSPLGFSWSFVFTPATSSLTNADILDATTAAARFTPDVGGSYILRVTVDDGERADSDNVLIFADVVAPTLQFVNPLNGALLNTNTPTLDLTFSDDESGVDTGTLVIQIGGQNLDVSCSFGAGSASCTPTSALPEGNVTLTATIADVAGNVSAPAQVNFTVDTIAPVISFTEPTEGSTVNTDTPTIELSFSDAGSGVDTGTLVIQANGSPLAVTCTFTATSATCTPTTPLPTGANTLTATIQDLAGNLSAAAQVNFTVQLVAANQPPVLDPIGDQIVALGSSLTVNLSASDPDLDPLAFSANPVPLPANTNLDSLSGVFTFTPLAAQVGIVTLTFIVSDGGLTDSETITITVQGPDSGGITSFTGRLLDANDFDLGMETPVVGAIISFLGTGESDTSDAQGNFTVTNLPAGSQVLDIDSSTANPAPDTSPYAGFREDFDLIADVNNVVGRPFFLPRIDVTSLTPVIPTTFTTVTNPGLGVSITVPPNTAKNPDGTNFTGDLSISLVPRDLAPVALPDFLDPGLLITIQPVGVTFATPIPITFPNIDNLPPGSGVNLWSLDPDLGVFSIVGTGVVTADGTKIETVSGGIRAADWQTFSEEASEPDGDVPAAGGASEDCPIACGPQISSTVQLQNGSIEVDFFLPSYRSLGIPRSLRFVYKTSWANPTPVIPFNSTIPVSTAVPQTISSKVSVAGISQGNETFVNTSGLSQNIAQVIRQGVSIKGTTFTTGRYPITVRVTSNYAVSRISADIDRTVQIRNESKSPIGVGWALEGLERIFTNFDDSLSVVTSQGALILFTPEEASPPFVNFSPPAGDFSTLVKNVNDTFTRTSKDGIQINFDTEGLQTSLVDRNGNTTTYAYDASDRLISITDPANLITTFTYTGGLLSAVTDPAGRTTSFTHNAQGDLAQITFPDTATRIFGYDNRHLMIAETNERGFTAQRNFDSVGRFVSGTRVDGTPASATNIQSVGLVDAASGTGTEANPAPVVRPVEAVSTLTDGKGNTTSFETDQFGAAIRQVDALGQITLIDRDDDGNPTQITGPNGAVVTMSYDAVGDLLTSTDPVGAFTSFTYDPTFNQITSITDAKNNATTINYDLNGNPIEIIDAVTNRTEMTYDSLGLPTSVTAAVGEPEENTTTFTYDANGNLLTTTDHLLNVTTLEYDLAGNVIKSTDPENRVTEFSYDSMNRLTSVLDANLEVTQYGYDARGNLTQVTDAKNQTTTLTYDEMDRFDSATNPLSLTETFTYDANGNLISTTNRNAQTLTFDYDVLDRLVQKTLPPSASQIGSQITTFDYDLVGNLTTVTNPATTVTNQYDVANRLIASVSTDEEALGSLVTVINQPTLIDENNFEFEGKTLQVDGTTLTVDGSHTFANLILVNGAVLTHSPTTGTEVKQLDVNVLGVLSVDATSRIDVSGQGFLGANQPGNPHFLAGTTVGFQAGSAGNSGGSYGGLGTGNPNPVYGDFQDPADPGSGGGSDLGIDRGGNGGGLVRIVTQTLQLDGSIKADGVLDAGNRGGGSGGGIRIDVGTLSGSGNMTASGAAGSGGVGGGGRVAVYHENATGFNFANVTASGGVPGGQDGTVFLQQQTFMGVAPVGMDLPIFRAQARPSRSLIPNSFPVHSAGTRSDVKHLELPDLTRPVAEMESHRSSLGRGERKTYRAPAAAFVASKQQNRYLAMANNAGAEDDFDPIYTYDLNGNRALMIDPTGLTTYTYDTLNRLTSITNPSGQTTTYTYDTLSRRTSITHDNDVVTTYTYDSASRLLSLVHQLGATTINSFTYTYDDVGNRLTKTDNEGTASYTYDSLNRLVEAMNPLPSNPLESFTYDELGNRVDSNQNGLSTFNVANQLNEDANFTYAYDANGNQIQKTDKATLLSTQYEYDAENHLFRVIREDSSIVNYQYDGLGRRIEKDVAGVITGYIYDNEDILLELDGTDTIVARSTHGPGIDEPLIMERDLDASGTFEATEQFLYHVDGLGSVTELTNNAGTVIQSYTYSSFGEIESTLDPSFVQPYTFTAREFDPETGLLHYRARSYDPMTGRFLQQDPILGFQVVPQSFNLYSYVVNNPVLFLDPSGTVCIFYQGSGRLICARDDATHAIYIDEIGYSGFGTGRDNPDMNDVRDMGPLPRGEWIVGPPEDRADTGLISRPLIPQFFGLHGNSVRPNRIGQTLDLSRDL